MIADEAHRSQYGFLKGYARYLAEALPNARRIGFTGTPISFSGADTVEVFGDLIHTYDIQQAQDDGTTVPIYYAPRQVRLHLSRGDVDAALRELAEGQDVTDLERRKSRWAALAAAAGARDRLETLTRDLLDHFRERSATLTGKALVYEQAYLRDLVHEVVQSIKQNLKVDWTEPHRDDVKAGVRAAVRRVLRARGVRAEHFEPLLASVMAQAEALYAAWPVAA